MSTPPFHGYVLLPPGLSVCGTDFSERLAQLPKDEPLVFGNEVYRVKFDEQDPTPRFGHRYTFFLQDAVEEVPEYVVYWDEFVQCVSLLLLPSPFPAQS